MVVEDAVLLTERSALGVTVVSWMEELLTGLGSSFVEVTIAVFVFVPGVVGLTTMVTVAEVLAFMVPRLHTTVPVPEQLPFVVLEDTNVSPAGRPSVTVTLSA